MATTEKFLRVDRLLSNLGLCTRREANAFIRKNVTVDGVRPPSQALRIDPARLIIQGKPAASLVKPIHIALHKPASYVCSRVRGPHQHALVYDLLPAEWLRRRPLVNTIGRLDMQASGLLLMTQDGPLINQVCSGHHEREYIVKLTKPITPEDVAMFTSGRMELRGEEGKPLLPAVLEAVKTPSSTTEGEGNFFAKVVVREGRYHQVRRMFESLGNQVLAIHRVRIGSITLQGLKEGTWRELTQSELSSFASEKKMQQQQQQVFLTLPDVGKEFLTGQLKNSADFARLCLGASNHAASILDHALGQLGASEKFFNHTVPHFRKLFAEELPQLFPGGRVQLLLSDETVDLSRRQVAALVAMLFFGVFDRTKGMFPQGVDFNKYVISLLFAHEMIAPITCIVHYLNRVADGECVFKDRIPFRLKRFRVAPKNLDEIPNLQRNLCNVHCTSDVFIEDTPHALHADFANKYPGGGTLEGGCVQEEILFVIKPECLVSMLLIAKLEDNEAFAIEGAERYARYAGYGRTWRFAGDFREKDSSERASAVIGIDAAVIRGPTAGLERQLSDQSFLRDLRKCVAGIEPYGEGVTFSTGNWGCGAFGGDKHVKALQQILACSHVNQNLEYCTFGERSLQASIEKFCETFKGCKIGEVMDVFKAVRGQCIQGNTLLDLMIEKKKSGK